ncbi:S1C family serine protease [Sporosarcina luteola]|uniref:S1C family serine protease n=1 Tax=Sporosarcina luteola TaxID=582850 RepID=UPI00203D9B3D|nr:serine protease [Sporosarcina luteola]MCM3710982.1 serine protease [Sporosarcina luteola]
MTVEKNDEHTENDEQYAEDLSEEEMHLLVLQAQQEALMQQQDDAIPKKEIPKSFIWLLSIMLFLSTFAGLFQIFSIPAIDFLMTSASLSKSEDIAEFKKSVVVVVTEDGKGTGFSVSSDGTILTNYHVVEENRSVSVVFPDDGRYEATVKETFPSIDVAILEVHGSNLPFLEIDHFSKMAKDDPLTFIGNPLSFKGIANEGSILAPIKLTGWSDEVMMIKAPVYRGNSGSPVLNEDGKVIGIIFATMDHKEHGKVGLFIPVSLLHENLSDEEETRE